MPSALAFVHAMLLHFQSLPFSAMYCNVKGKIDVSKHREEEGATFPTFETIMQASLFLIAVVSTALGKAQCKTIPNHDVYSLEAREMSLSQVWSQELS